MIESGDCPNRKHFSSRLKVESLAGFFSEDGFGDPPQVSGRSVVDCQTDTFRQFVGMEFPLSLQSVSFPNAAAGCFNY